MADEMAATPVTNGNGHLPEEVTISDYLLTRLVQVNVKRIFGVPGDFFLRFLDYVEDHPSIEWIGGCNELNSAYAADGEARLKQGLAVVATTFGVGELSCVNAFAGSYSEHVPVLHIVGVPSTGLQSKGAMLHHTLGDGRFDAFQNVYANITCATAHIKRPQEAGQEIDRAIFEALKHNKPTYLTLPTDLVDAKISAAPLRTPVTQQSINRLLSAPGVEADVEDAIIKKICRMYARAERPCILVDAGVLRFRIIKETRSLIDATGMTFFSSPMGKTAIDEDHPQFGGIYVGNITLPTVKDAFEDSDFCLIIGGLKTDFNTASFSYRISPNGLVELHHDRTLIQYATYPNAGYRSLLPKLIPEMAKVSKEKNPAHFVTRAAHGGLTLSAKGDPSRKNQMITHDEFWPLWASWFKPMDVVVSEIGTASFGLLDCQFPAGSTMLSQILWGSIGWACGATLGAALEARDQGRRTILFSGDGSTQLTVQEISTMIRHKLNPIIVILNNSGYVVERLIHGPTRKYNDIQLWQWQKLLEVFSPEPGSYASYRTNDREELEALLANEDFNRADKIQLVECILGGMDAPRALMAQANMVTNANKPVDSD